MQVWGESWQKIKGIVAPPKMQDSKRFNQIAEVNATAALTTTYLGIFMSYNRKLVAGWGDSS
jgi:hypothetical protein